MRLRLVAPLVVLALLPCLAIPLAQEKVAPEKQPSADSAAAASTARRPLANATAFLDTLDSEQRAKTVLPYDSPQRVAWHFIPMESRKGLPLMEMNAAQQKAAHALLRSALSQAGYTKSTRIMQLESLLLQLEGPQSQGRRNPQKYYFTVFGQPAMKQVWGLSIEGHHLSLNFSLRGNRIIDSTPQFLGANPAEIKDDYGDDFKKGGRVLREEEQLAFALLNSLTEAQRSQAILPGEVPQEIRAAGQAQPPSDAPQGIAAADLTAAQQTQLKQLIEVYSSQMKPQVAKQRWELIEKAGFAQIHFAWAGAQQRGVGHYYILQGKTFLIEFINVQPDADGNPANHIHCVWRDLQGDFNLPLAGK
ncbi:MAG: DUF3500 domain-containing protein [Planctomycetales bacterium]|nr:DUF3500 domain-containing protein [Planctomycetales bacterium]